MSRLAPTKAEADRIARMLRKGCIITLLKHGTYAPAECHHIVIADRRLGHGWTIPLTPYYHRGVITDSSLTRQDAVRLYGATIADGSKAFLASHGKSDLDLWREVQRMLGLDDLLPISKILPRREVA